MDKKLIRVADEIWVATALLHTENPERNDFTPTEIVQRALRENLAGRYRPGLMAHASNHCVASKAPNPARLRMLHETARGHRRLFRPGDPFHRGRKRGRMTPAPDDLPPSYRGLLDWYRDDYMHNGRKPRSSPLPEGAPSTVLLKFVGSIPQDDLRLMERIIEEDCERIDPNEW